MVTFFALTMAVADGGRGRQSRPWLNAIAMITIPDRARVSAAEGGKGSGSGLVWVRIGECEAGSEVGAYGSADQVGEAGGYRAQEELAEGAAEEGAVGELGHHAAADEGG